MKQPGFYWIYVLRDTSGNEVYVGQSIARAFPKRLNQHIRDALKGSLSPFHVWLRDRIAAGNLPSVHAIERVPAAQGNERERYWINFYDKKTEGKLLNDHDAKRVRPHFKRVMLPSHVCTKACELDVYPCKLCGLPGYQKHRHGVPSTPHLKSRRHKQAVANLPEGTTFDFILVRVP